MTSVLPPSPKRSPRRLAESSGDLTADDLRDLRHRRPLVAVAVLGGVGAAMITLVACMAVGVIGWFLSDAGAHGTPSDAVRIGALGWLLGHGSGVTVSGSPVTVVPLGLTIAVVWTIWQVGVRVGDSVSLHGPDADGLADGERDWTVPLTAGLFAAAYAVTGVLVAVCAGTAATAPSSPAVVAWSIGLGVVVGLPAIAVGSGRAALWMTLLPTAAVDTMVMARSILLWWAGVSTVVLFVALFADLGTSVNVISQLHLGVGAVILYSLLAVLVLPNAVVFASAYLLGPGFTMGVGTTVTTTHVALGPLPMFPLLAALPDNGTPSLWVSLLLALGPLCAAYAVVRVQRHRPTLLWGEGALRAGCAGVVAGIVVGVLSSVAGGAVGPGRMADVAPYAGQVLVHAVAFFGLAGVLAGLGMTWWHRRAL